MLSLRLTGWCHSLMAMPKRAASNRDVNKPWGTRMRTGSDAL